MAGSGVVVGVVEYYSFLIVIFVTQFLILAKSENLRKIEQQGSSTTGGFTTVENTEGLVTLPFMISPMDFYSKFVAKHKPVRYSGTAELWPATKLWTNDYILSAYNSTDSQHVQVSKQFNTLSCHGNQKGSHISLDEFLKRYLNERLVLMERVKGKMRQDVAAPLCLRCDEMMNSIQLSYWLQHVNTSLSSYLNLNTHERMMTVIDGMMSVLLVSSLQSTAVMKIAADQGIDSVVEQGIPHIITHVHKGDMLYIPQTWWYIVTVSSGRSLVINFDWMTRLKQASLPRLEANILNLGDQTDRQFIARLLKVHEEQTQSAQPRSLQCSTQDRRMSEYTFETGKMSRDDYEKIHNGPDLTEQEHCIFDGENKFNPCNYDACVEDTESTVCVRYTLEYCARWEDRGCVIELPQVMNKMDPGKREDIFSIESPYPVQSKLNEEL